MTSPGVAVDSHDNVYVLNRSEHPVIVFDRDGNFLRSWGEGAFSDRTHGIYVGPDDSVFCVDDGLHTGSQVHTGRQVAAHFGNGKPAGAQMGGETV